MFFCVVSASRPWQMQFSVPFRRDRRRRSSTRPRPSLSPTQKCFTQLSQPALRPSSRRRSNQRPGSGPHFDHLHVEGRAQPEYWQAQGAFAYLKAVSRSRPLTKSRSLARSRLPLPRDWRRRDACLEANPDAQPIISLGIGDTTMRCRPSSGVSPASARHEGGLFGLRRRAGPGPAARKISENLYGSRVAPEEVFVSDGGKCDIGRLQMMFGKDMKTAVRPSYPVYVDTSVIMGQTGEMNQELKLMRISSICLSTQRMVSSRTSPTRRARMSSTFARQTIRPARRQSSCRSWSIGQRAGLYHRL